MVSIKFEMKYLVNQMSQDAEILLGCVQEDHLNGSFVVQNKKPWNIHIFIAYRDSVINYFKFDS